MFALDMSPCHRPTTPSLSSPLLSSSYGTVGALRCRVQHPSAFLVTLNFLQIASSIVAADRWKAADVNIIVSLCSALHQRYADFTSTLLHSIFNQMTSCMKAAVVAPGATPSQIAAAYANMSSFLTAVSAAQSRVPVVASEADLGGALGGDFSADGFDAVSSSAKRSGGNTTNTNSASAELSAAFTVDPKVAGMRVRFLLRLLIELSAVNIYSDEPHLIMMLLSLLGIEPSQAHSFITACSKDTTEAHNNILQPRVPHSLAVMTKPSAAAGSSEGGGLKPPMSLSEALAASIAAVNEKAARKAARDLPLLLRVLQSCPGVLYCGCGINAT
jgi:hypothetical protein